MRKRCPLGRKPWVTLIASLSLQDLVVAELDDPVARGAVQVIVGGVAVIVLERAAVGQPQLAEQSGLDQQPQGAINRRAADAVPGVVEVADQLVGVEVLVGIEDMAPPASAAAR